MHRRLKRSLPKVTKEPRLEIAQSLHDGLAVKIDSIAADLAEVIGRRGLTPATRTKLREIAAAQNNLSSSLRAEILKLKGATPAEIDQLINIRELAPLTKKEREILTYLAKALTAKEISVKLFVSTATVKTHLAAIYRKLGVTNKTAALARATESGILTL